jgi:hypothetical protein
MSRRAAVITLAAGLGVIAVAQYASPLGSPPLYDGVVPQEPYRYLVPRSNQGGPPSSYHGSVPVTGATSPPFVAATTESPPQAQLIAASGAFVLPLGVTSLTVSIEPVADAPSPASGAITGNVYRVSVADQAGTELSIDPATMPTVSLRAPNGVVVAAISQLVGGAWHDLPTGQGGEPGIFLADVTDLGDFTTIEQAQSQGGPESITVVLGAATAIITAAVLGGVLLWRRSRPTKVLEPAPPVPRRPSKRRRGARRRGGSR